MKISFFTFLLLCLHLVPLSAQKSIDSQCECEKDFSFVTNYLENHYAGFQDNVRSDNRADYEALKNQLIEKSKAKQTSLQCMFVLKEYVNFFRDRHLQIRFGKDTQNLTDVNEKSDEDVRKFKEGSLFLSRERIACDSLSIWNHLAESTDALEGIYENDVYQIALLQNKTNSRDYYGIITRSKTALWERGQVKMEIKKFSDSSFQTVLYLRNHAANLQLVDSGNPILAALPDFKKSYPSTQTSSNNRIFSAGPLGKWFQFKELNDSTYYLYIRTFHGSLKGKFDSAFKKIVPMVQKKPNLLIDIRDNGGGSDFCWRKLERLLYTQPIPEEQMDFYCSTETIKRSEEWLAEMKKNRKGYGWMTIKYFKIKIRKMKKQSPGSFMPMKTVVPWYAKPFVNLEATKYRKVYAMPKKVILMYNRNSASAAEGLILSSRHSRKVMTFGENSGGYTTFGDVRVVNTPSGFSLQSGMNRIEKRFQYEKVGIPPQMRANNDQDWIEQTYQLWKLIK